MINVLPTPSPDHTHSYSFAESNNLLYNTSGVLQTGFHLVIGSVTVSTLTSIVSLSGLAAFSSAGSYMVTSSVNDTSYPTSEILKVSGTSFKINVLTNGSQVISYIAVGN